MRLFKQHRGGNTSHSNSPDGSPRGVSPARASAYYLPDPSKARAEVLEDPSIQATGQLNPPSAFSQPRFPDEEPRTVLTDQGAPIAVDQRLSFSHHGGQGPSLSGSAVRQQSIAGPEEKEREKEREKEKEKEGKKSKRSYFGIPSHSKESASKLVGRSTSLRRNQPPQPTVDTTVPLKHDKQPHSASELSQGFRQRFPESPADVGREAQREGSFSYHTPNDISVQRRPVTTQYDKTPGLAHEVSSDLPDPQIAPQTSKDTAKRPESPYTAYHPPRSAGRDSLQAYEAYRGRPSSQQSVGPPSPLDQSSKAPRGPYAEVAAQPPPEQPHAHPLDTMGQEGSAKRTSVQAAHGHGHESGQYSQYNGNPVTQKQNAPNRGISGNEMGRSTPPPSSRSREDLSSADVASLMQKHEELLAKYSKVKKYYFDKEAQVQQLQNIVAHQRLSMNNTSLDDNEYQTRFERLNGAINNFAFNVRKDWKSIPPWLHSAVNKDCVSVGTKEMTAVGRACIARWLVDEIFDRYFHPGVDPILSSQLKIIEHTIRRNMLGKVTAEEAQKEDHSVKLSNWRLTTVEGLQEMLMSPQAGEYRTQLTATLIEKLLASLQMNLASPPPPGLEAGVAGIIELAVGIAANIPLESRDVCVEYFMPGTLISENYMKIETTLPALTTPMSSTDFPLSDLDQADRASNQSAESLTDTMQAAAPSPRGDSVGSAVREKKKSIFGGLVTKKPAPGESARSSSQIGGEKDRDAGREREANEKLAAERERRIRFAAFMTVEVRGKGKDGGNVLVKAPCFSYGERKPDS